VGWEEVDSGRVITEHRRVEGQAPTRNKVKKNQAVGRCISLGIEMFYEGFPYFENLTISRSRITRVILEPSLILNFNNKAIKQ
jgi:hypothetical protein